MKLQSFEEIFENTTVEYPGVNLRHMFIPFIKSLKKKFGLAEKEFKFNDESMFIGKLVCAQYFFLLEDKENEMYVTIAVENSAYSTSDFLDIKFTEIKNFNFIVFSSADPKELAKIFPDEIKMIHRKKNFYLKKKDFTEIEHIKRIRKNMRYGKVIPSKLSYNVEYSVTEEDTELLDLTKLEGYKKFLEETGLVLKSTERQLKNGTWDFGFPTEYAIRNLSDQESYDSLTDNGSSKYLLPGIQIASSGIVRTFGTFRINYGSPYRSFDRAQKVKTFTNLSDGLEIAKTKWKQIKDKFLSNIVLAITPEEKHENRGSINSTKFNF